MHHLGRSAARAQIVKRKTEHQQKCREEHVGRTGDDRTHKSGMKHNQERGDECNEKDKPIRRNLRKQKAAMSGKKRAATSAGAGAPAGASHATSVVARNGSVG